MKLTIKYEMSPREAAAVGYAHGEIVSTWADDEEFRGETAEEILDAVRDGSIWNRIELPEGWELIEDAEADRRGVLTAWVRAYADGDYDAPVAESRRVIATGEGMNE